MEEYGAMNSKDLVVDYLADNEEGMKNVITWFLNDAMQREADKLVGAGKYERTGSRRTYRNGTRSRSLKTRYGSLSLDKPLLRDIPFKTQVFERYSQVEKALENAIIESYLQGVSTRKIQNVISTLGVNKISPSYVSSIAKELDSKVMELLSRPIDTYIPYIFVDASYFKVREGIRYANKALLIVAGIRSDGIREIFGAWIADCENELTWEDLISDLKDRGLERVDLVVSDGQKAFRLPLNVHSMDVLANMQGKPYPGRTEVDNEEGSQAHCYDLEGLFDWILANFRNAYSNSNLVGYLVLLILLNGSSTEY